MAARRSSPAPWLVGGGVIFILGLGALALARSRGQAAAAPSVAGSITTNIDAVMASGTGSSAAKDAMGRPGILEKKTLAEAIDATKLLMTNTNGRLDQGTALLSLWASKNLTWDELSSRVETTPALFRKDPEAERGKRFCISGVINEIRAERTLATRLVADRALPLIREQQSQSGAPSIDPMDPTPEGSGAPAGAAVAASGGDAWEIPDDGKVFFATISTKPPETAPDSKPHVSSFHPLVVEVIAVRSTGTLVDGGEVRACGILTGVTMAAGAREGDPIEHRIVGLFDLPENRSATVAKTGTE